MTHMFHLSLYLLTWLHQVPAIAYKYAIPLWVGNGGAGEGGAIEKQAQYVNEEQEKEEDEKEEEDDE